MPIGQRTLILLLLLLVSHSSSHTIKHIVVVMEENRSFDHMFGWYPGVDGLNGKEYNVVNTSNPKSEQIYVNKAAISIAPCDPDHGTPATTSKIFGKAALQRNDTSVAGMVGFVEWEGLIGNAKTNYCEVMSMLTPNHVPIITTLADEFVLFDRFFADYPGPTWPNRLFMLSATSAGLTDTGEWYQNKNGALFPQETIFDQLTKEGLTWRNYYNDTPWELMLGTFAHNPEYILPMDQFYEDAAKGNLPNFAWINPRSGINMTLMQGSNDQHPDHDVSLGEQYYKDIYESLRASPSWNETLFIVTYDEHGGFFDHVPTPLHVPPPGDGESSYPDLGVLFNRLGIRIPTLLISPWLPKGLVVNEPPKSQKPASNSEFSLSSIIATTRKLLNMTSPPLTKRDAWVATFEHLFNLSSPRTDCPLHLPPTIPPVYSPHAEADFPLNGLQKHILTVNAQLSGLSGIPEHVKTQKHVADFARKSFHEHSRITANWKASKLAEDIEVVMWPSNNFTDTQSQFWTVNISPGLPYCTISILPPGLLCLDFELETKLVGVSNCYPSANPRNNRDLSQHWVWEKDATVRPRMNSSLCLTTKLWEGDTAMYILPCVNSVEQHFAYHGLAPGNDDSGSIVFGDTANNLGIVNVTSSK